MLFDLYVSITFHYTQYTQNIRHKVIQNQSVAIYLTIQS